MSYAESYSNFTYVGSALLVFNVRSLANSTVYLMWDRPIHRKTGNLERFQAQFFMLRLWDPLFLTSTKQGFSIFLHHQTLQFWTKKIRLLCKVSPLHPTLFSRPLPHPSRRLTAGVIGGGGQQKCSATSTSISAISDIRHRHLLFRYRKKICRTENCHSDIGRVPISTSESILISDIQKIFITPSGFELKTLVFSATVLIYEFLDVGYRIKVYSDIRYNVGLRSLQSDIGSSDIKISPISLITDIGVSAHLCRKHS
jgi:hypothetical protein